MKKERKNTWSSRIKATHRNKNKQTQPEKDKGRSEAADDLEDTPAVTMREGGRGGAGVATRKAEMTREKRSRRKRKETERWKEERSTAREGSN